MKTQDGYILSMQRIPEGRAGGGGNKQPVLIQHGVLVVSAFQLTYLHFCKANYGSA